MKKFVLILLILLSIFVLSGCPKDDKNDYENKKDIVIDYENKETISLVIIAGKHANSNNFSKLMMEQTMDLVSKAIRYEKDGSLRTATVDVTLIVCDGKPRVEKLTVGDGFDLQTSAKNDDRLEENVAYLLKAIETKLTSDEIRAQDPGCDLQVALSQARKVLNKKKDVSEKHILILDTGVCTEGNVDMRKLNFMDGTVEDVLSRIDSSSFPILEEFEVTFLGLGNVADPQADLSNAADIEQKLVDFWTIYLEEKCGATLAEEILYEPSVGDPLSSNENDENPYPYVPVVDFLGDQSFTLPPIYSAEIGFKPNSAEFKDNSQAKKVIENYAQYLKEYFKYNPNNVVYIVGSIARTSANESVSANNIISLKRATKIYDMLLNGNFGFLSSQFKIIDAGTTPFSWRNHDEFPGGVYSPGNQEANRVVALIPETDVQHVQELKDAGEI